MSEETKDDRAAGESLRFDRAEFDAGPVAAACAACHQPIPDVYYDINGKLYCEKCRADLELSRTDPGSGLGRFVRATVFGTVAAVLGFALYYVVSLTGYEFSLIAIVVGFAVGKAVHAGAQGRGGWLYQALAMFLTYTAIVATYVPQAYTAMAADKATGAAGFAVTLLVLVVFAFVAPFLAGLRNIIGLLIIGVGLYEAWKINKRVEVRVSGPYRVGQPARPEADPA